MAEMQRSYDVLGTQYERAGDKCTAIHQIVSEMAKLSPSDGLIVSFAGDVMKVVHHCYAVGLNDPAKLTEARRQSRAFLDRAISKIKSEYKKRTKSKLDCAEQKEKRGESVQKVSLNDRYYLLSYRFYDVS